MNTSPDSMITLHCTQTNKSLLPRCSNLFTQRVCLASGSWDQAWELGPGLGEPREPRSLSSLPHPRAPSPNSQGAIYCTGLAWVRDRSVVVEGQGHKVTLDWGVVVMEGGRSS